jgi:hypothetical protein
MSTATKEPARTSAAGAGPRVGLIRVRIWLALLGSPQHLPDGQFLHAPHAQIARRANLPQGCALAPTCQNVSAGSRMPATAKLTLHGVVFDILGTRAMRLACRAGAGGRARLRPSQLRRQLRRGSLHSLRELASAEETVTSSRRECRMFPVPPL